MMNILKRLLSEFGRLVKSLILIAVFTGLPTFSQTSGQINSFALRGEVKDQRGAVIAGAEIILSDASNGAEQKTVSDEQGAFRFERLAKGVYDVRISAEGFGAYEEKLNLSSAANSTPISIVLYPTIRADVEVQSDAEIALDAERAAGTQVLGEKEINDLPDDPDQLNQQLQNLAASGGGIPGQAIVTVDGFLTGGGLPPKSSIRQIRINPNLYSAEYDTPPFQGGRVEITTKPGSGTFTGSAFFNYNAAALNARDPFAIKRADTNTKRYGFNFGMPIIKNRAGLFFDFERREINESAAVNAIVLDDDFQISNFTANVPNPRRLTIGSARADWQLNQNNTVVFRYDFNQNKLSNQGIGGVNLPERGFDNNQTENSFRFTETAVLSPRTVNELRFGLTFNRIEQTAASDAPAIIVAGSFSSGGAGLQKLDRDERRLEITDYVTTDIKKHSLKFGVQIFSRRVSEIRAENTNGSFFFGGATFADGTCISSLEQYRRALLNLPGGTPTRFSLTIGEPRASVNQWLISAFIQDEWKLSPKVSLSVGLRYEAQTAPNDLLGFAPRFGIAYTPDKKQNWIFRARTGIFYDRIGESLTLESNRLDGRRQQQIIVDSPAFPNPFSTGGINNAIPTRRIFVSDLKPPASWQTRFEVERLLPQGWKMSASYSWTLSRNALRSRNINAPLVSALNPNPRTAPRPFGTLENALQFESSGKLNGRVLYVGVNQNTNKFFSLNAGYLFFDFLTDADSAFALPQSSYDFSGERARPFWQTRHRVFVSATANLPYKLRLSAQFNAASGAPFNITTGRDNNGDGNFNDRPDLSFANDSEAISTIFGFLNPNVVSGNFRRNAGTNLGSATLDLNLSRTFLVGNKKGSGESRYRLTVNIRAANALNRANLLGTIGVLSSPLFGRATTANPARRIEFGARFNF